MEFIGYAAGLAMGLVLGLLGGGGSVLTVPILVYLFELPPTLATGYSLFVVGVTALIGCIMYIRTRDINLKVGLLFAIPSIIGVNLSRALILPSIPEVVFQHAEFTITKDLIIMATFAILMIFASRSMISKRKQAIKQQENSPLYPVIMAGGGLIVGIIAGFLGAGGGFLIIPALVVFAGLSMRIAVGTSLMIIALQSIIGFAGDIMRGLSADWFLLGGITAVAVGGIIMGAMLAHRMKEYKLKIAFGWFVLAIGTAILIEQIRHL